MSIRSLFKKKDKLPHASAVIVAAGSSQRMGKDKLTMMLLGRPVLARALLAFERCELIDEIVVVAREDRVVEFAEMCKNYGISKVSKVVCGGETRMESALSGVCEVDRKAKLIAIHDGARPLVTDDVIRRTVIAAAERNCVVPVAASADTLKLINDNGMTIGSVDREHTVKVQTPQVFDSDIIKGALTNAVSRKLSITDDSSAVEALNFKVYTVEGDEGNIKITKPIDISLAESIMRARGEII